MPTQLLNINLRASAKQLSGGGELYLQEYVDRLIIEIFLVFPL